jgi:hypothetical protein
MICTNLERTTGVDFAYSCKLKMKSKEIRIKIHAALLAKGIEKGSGATIACPIASFGKTNFEDCPWHNKPSFK